jgi:hypothetical protein
MTRRDGATDALGPIGLVVNPRSGNDVRRVIASAGSSTLDDKISIVRRIAKGASAVGASHFVTNHEPHQVVRRATETLRGITIERLDDPIDHTEDDTTRAVVRMRERGCAVVVVLGGDGTNRAAAKGWSDIPVIPLSTGTNNAFPYWAEPTVAGSAAGLLATGAVAADDAVLRAAKVVRVAMPGADAGERGEAPSGWELALIDAVAVADRWVGSLELFDPDTMRVAVLTRADPAAIGFSAVGGLLHPCGPAEPHGVLVRFAPVASRPPVVLRAPTAPGHYDDVGVLECRPLPPGEPVEVEGPVLLAFDGERKRRLHEGERAVLTVRHDGPRVVDVGAVMAAASHGGLFVRQSP